MKKKSVVLKKERDVIVRFGNKMTASGLTTGTGGNLSLFNRDEGLIAISPSGIEYADIKSEDVVVINLDGKTVDGSRAPSSELNFHLGLYRYRQDICSVVHTHSPYAATLACLGWEIPAVHYLVGFSGKKVPVAPYATFGTETLARHVVESIGDYNAVLMANHGLITVGVNMPTAFAAAEEIEFVARIYYQTRCIGTPQILCDEEMAIVIEKFKTYGQRPDKDSTR
jgi:L-fuculose-phosphate aldolase